MVARSLVFVDRFSLICVWFCFWWMFCDCSDLNCVFWKLVVVMFNLVFISWKSGLSFFLIGILLTENRNISFFVGCKEANVDLVVVCLRKIVQSRTVFRKQECFSFWSKHFQLFLIQNMLYEVIGTRYVIQCCSNPNITG